MDNKVMNAPVSLTGLFGNDSDEDVNNSFQNESDIQSLVFGGISVQIQQTSWHQANANQVWPGAYALVEHIMQEKLYCAEVLRYGDSKILELGAATGAVAVALTMTGKFNIITR
jgi:hypothetical protein